MIKSRWRITLNGLTLLDHGDWMPDTPSMPLAGSVQENRFIGADWGGTIGRGNKLRSFTWSRVLEFSTVAERMGFQIALPSLYAVGKTFPLIVEIEDGSTHGIERFTLAGCVPTEIETEPTNLALSFEGQGGRDYIIDRNGLGGPSWEEIWQAWGSGPYPAALTLHVSDQPTETVVLYVINPLSGRYYYGEGSPEQIWNNGTRWIIGTHPGISTWEGPLATAGPLGTYTKIGDPGFPVSIDITLTPGAGYAPDQLPPWGTIPTL